MTTHMATATAMRALQTKNSPLVVNLASPPWLTWTIAKPAAAGRNTARVRTAGEAIQLLQAAVRPAEVAWSTV